MLIPASELITEISTGTTEEITQQVAIPTKTTQNMLQNGQITAPRPPQNRAPSQAASPKPHPGRGRAPINPP
jgi:twitching motility protein PilT